MSAGSHEAMHILLRAGSSLFLKSRLFESEVDGMCAIDDLRGFISAIEFACLLDQPEMLKVLLSYAEQKDHDQKGSKVFIYFRL